MQHNPLRYGWVKQDSCTDHNSRCNRLRQLLPLLVEAVWYIRRLWPVRLWLPSYFYQQTWRTYVVLLVICPYWSVIYIWRFIDGSSQPQVSPECRKRNMKLFGSSATAPPATRWYEKNFPPFVNYDQDSMWFYLIVSFLMHIFILSENISSHIWCQFSTFHVHEGWFCGFAFIPMLQKGRWSKTCRSSPQWPHLCLFLHEHLFVHLCASHPWILNQVLSE